MKLNLYYDSEADYLEIRFGELKPSYFEDIGDDVFERRDEKTSKVTGYAIYNARKRQLKKH